MYKLDDIALIVAYWASEVVNQVGAFCLEIPDLNYLEATQRSLKKPTPQSCLMTYTCIQMSQPPAIHNICLNSSKLLSLMFHFSGIHWV